MKQFETDLAGYAPAEVVAEAMGKAPDALPALRIEVTGMVTASNLEQFKAHSMAVLESIKTVLETDQHFADAEQRVKWCGDVEERLEAAKQHALSETESIDILFRTITKISAEVRAKRLMLDKLVKARKVSIREDIVMDAAKALQTHLDQINTSLGGKARMPLVPADFAGAIKGKKSISSLRDAADSELARAKIEASHIADGIRANLASLVELAADHLFLFNDVQQLALKANDDLVALIKVRIAEHQAAAAELTRRLTAQSIGPSAEREELQESIRRFESETSDAEEENENLRHDTAEACERIRRAMDPEDRELSLNELLQKALNCLE